MAIEPADDDAQLAQQAAHARLVEVDRATTLPFGAVCITMAVAGAALLPFYGGALTLTACVPLLSWLMGRIWMRDVLGVRFWVVFHLLAVELAIVGAALATGGADSPLLMWVGVLGAFIVFYFPRYRTALIGSPLVVGGVTLGHLASGAPIDSPLTTTMSFLIALVLPGTIIQMVRMELTHRRRAVIDPLTGCLNRHAFDDRIAVLEAQMSFTREPIGVVIFDIDHFKRINDTHGHATGDAVLAEVAYAVRKSLRSYEALCRLGGEEFAILLPGADLVMSARIAERVRVLVEELTVGDVNVTISCGVASAGGGGVTDIHLLLDTADKALYVAKDAGRNRTHSHVAA